ncbi:MAG TPA: DNA recombination protein RmuC [Candidatus Sumerlaeota bacterium]|nr:DNA recombination protein RmuC [Candidatus Sumerlaeota bacterium]
MEILLIVLSILVLVVIILQIALLFRKSAFDSAPILKSLESLEKTGERAERAVREEFATNRAEQSGSARQSREELAQALREFNGALLATIKEMSENQQRQLELMRATVDEKLQSTLEKRLGESFRQVSERLEQVYRGLGEMHTLAAGVGDLKKILGNVKIRGTWGETQLAAMLEQTLAADQYAANVATKDGGERVEFAIRLPGASENPDEPLWLPIDAKFPMEDFQRLLDAREAGDIPSADSAARQLEARIRSCAKDIRTKYINPPRSTDFGILFLPTEGLFAEVLRRPGLAESLQQELRIMIAGPTTLWSLLTSLQMGFRTLAIQKRTSEVWQLLAVVKTEWAKYGEALEKARKKIQEASDSIEHTQRRVRVIGQKLRNVQDLPAGEQEAAPVEEEEENRAL